MTSPAESDFSAERDDLRRQLERALLLQSGAEAQANYFLAQRLKTEWRLAQVESAATALRDAHREAMTATRDEKTNHRDALVRAFHNAAEHLWTVLGDV